MLASVLIDSMVRTRVLFVIGPWRAHLLASDISDLDGGDSNTSSLDPSAHPSLVFLAEHIARVCVL